MELSCRTTPTTMLFFERAIGPRRGLLGVFCNPKTEISENYGNLELREGQSHGPLEQG